MATLQQAQPVPRSCLVAVDATTGNTQHANLAMAMPPRPVTHRQNSVGTKHLLTPL